MGQFNFILHMILMIIEKLIFKIKQCSMKLMFEAIELKSRSFRCVPGLQDFLCKKTLASVWYSSRHHVNEPTTTADAGLVPISRRPVLPRVSKFSQIF
jgi:hypothetical protein